MPAADGKSATAEGCSWRVVILALSLVRWEIRRAGSARGRFVHGWVVIVTVPSLLGFAPFLSS